MENAYNDFNNGLNLKGDIIPDEWKPVIDTMLVGDLMEANRYFAQANPEIAKLVSLVASTAPDRFYVDLITRWNWHNKFYESILEPAIKHLTGENAFDVSPRQVAMIGKSYEVASLVDQSTLVASIAIKQCVEGWLNVSGNWLDEEDRYLLLTPPEDPFCVAFMKEHLDYLIARNEDEAKSEAIKADLMGRYHANDEAIFKGRLKSKLGDILDSDLETLKRVQASLLRVDNSVKYFYLTMGRPMLKAIRDLLVFDNYHEYRLATSLIGVSGFILRKKVLSMLHETKILQTTGGIYEHLDPVVLSGLEKLRAYRQEVLSRDVTPYKQRGITCAACCLMMAMHYLDCADLSSRTESDFHSRSKSVLVEGEHFAGLAKIAAEAGLEVILAHSEEEMFSNDHYLFAREVFLKLLSEYQSYLSSAEEPISVRCGVELDLDHIKNLLKNDYLVLLAGKIGQILHAVLAVGYNQQGIVVIDPLVGKKETYSQYRLDSFMGTSIGKWILAVRRNQKPVQDLMESLPAFKERAERYLEST